MNILAWFFNPNSSILYSFLAGIFISLAANLFTGAYLEEKLVPPSIIIHVSALSLLLGSIGFLMVVWWLEGIRRAVGLRIGSESAVPRHVEYQYTQQEIVNRRWWLLSTFIVSIIFIIYAIVILVTRQLFPL